MEKPTPKTQLRIWSVGQGDFISIINQKECLFIDAGGSIDASLKMLLFLRESCREKTNHIFISHFHRDHLMNFERLKKHLKKVEVYVSTSKPQNFMGKKFMHKLMLHSDLHIISNGFKKKFSKVDLKCLWPPKNFKHSKDENDNSLVLLLNISGLKILLTGDISKKVERKLELQPIDILKVAHHGSNTSTTDEFLVKTKPKACAISVGVKNTYGHPHPKVLKRLTQNHCIPLRTDQLGSLVMDL
ncbi:MAG: MBL fold metallo-hydrolase [Oligoflexia bacterium]|nr:MBL fold metallo-hydrolase [Oligoflexia bacterium]